MFGIVNHATNKAAVYLFGERIGPKNTDRTVSYLIHYLVGRPDFVRRVHLFLNNASSTNDQELNTTAWSKSNVRLQDNVQLLINVFIFIDYRIISGKL